MSVPTITAIAPVSGPPAGGMVVSLTGTALTGATGVHFGATVATPFAVLSDTLVTVVAPAGTGICHVTITTAGGTSVASGADEFTYSSGLFTLAEARAFVDGGGTPLADTAQYPDAAITACEVAIRELFTSACGIFFVPTSTTELLDGDFTHTLRTSARNPVSEVPQRPLTVTAASIDGIPLTAPELAAIKAHSDGTLVRTDGAWWGSSSAWWGGTIFQDLAVSVTITQGWASVPAEIKQAALMLAVRLLVGTDVPRNATSYTDGGASFNLTYAGQKPNWTGDAWIDAVLSRYCEDESVAT